MKKTSPTAAGLTNNLLMNSLTTNKPLDPDAQIDAINQVFALFRVNYHNQYYSAFNDTQLLNQTKILWRESLSRFTPEAILLAAKRAIEQSDYLPTLHKMIQYCQGDPSSYGLPNAHQAYVEACQARSPKTSHAWSHPAVYYAGRDTDWFFLATNPEHVAYPLFKEHYQRWCERVLAGETLAPIAVPQLSHETQTPLSKAENHQRLQAMRDSLKL